MVLDDALEPSERNLAKFAWMRDVAIESRECFLDTLAREIAGRILFHDATQDAVGIDRHAGRCAAADCVAAATSLGEHEIWRGQQT